MTYEEIKPLLQGAYTMQRLNALAKKADDKKAAQAVQARKNLISQSDVQWSCTKYGTEADVQYIIDTLAPAHWAYAYHDRDDKEPHWHVLLIFTKEVTAGHVLAYMDAAGENTRVEKMMDVYGAYKYLGHEDKNDQPLPNKYHYGMGIVKCDNGQWWLQQKDTHNADGTETDKAYQCLEDLLSGRYTTREMCRKYGRDFIINMEAYRKVATQISQEERWKTPGDTEPVTPEEIIDEIEDK